jgi:hypothetical protein
VTAIDKAGCRVPPPFLGAASFFSSFNIYWITQLSEYTVFGLRLTGRRTVECSAVHDYQVWLTTVSDEHRLNLSSGKSVRTSYQPLALLRSAQMSILRRTLVTSLSLFSLIRVVLNARLLGDKAPYNRCGIPNRGSIRAFLKTVAA